MEPLAQMLADTPKDFKKQTEDSIGKDATAFKDNAWNHNSTRAASLLTFVSRALDNYPSTTKCCVFTMKFQAPSWELGARSWESRYWGNDMSG